MALRPIDEVLINYFDLPAGPKGQVYRVPECDAATGILCQRLVTAAIAIQNGDPPPEDAPKLVFEGSDERDLQIRLLSQPVLDQMIADGIGASALDLCTRTILFWHGFGREMAEMLWEAGGRPEDFLPAVNRKGRRHPSKAAAKQTGSTSTDAETTTLKPAFGTTTTSRKEKSRRSRGQASHGK